MFLAKFKLMTWLVFFFLMNYLLNREDRKEKETEKEWRVDRKKNLGYSQALHQFKQNKIEENLKCY